MKKPITCKLSLDNNFESKNSYINKYTSEFNSELIQNNITFTKENSNREMDNFLNNLVNNASNKSNLLSKYGMTIEEMKNTKVNGKGGLRELYGHKPGDPVIKEAFEKGIPLYDPELKKYRKSTIEDYNKRKDYNYQYDEIFSFKRFLDDEELLLDAIRVYGTPEKAMKAVMGGDYFLNQQILTAKYNGRSNKSDNLGSTDDAWKGIIKEDPKEVEYLKNHHAKQENAIRKDMSGKALPSKLKNKLQFLRNIIINNILINVVDILNDEIMEISGELILKDPDKNFKEIIIETSKKDRLKKVLNKLFNRIKDIIKYAIGSFKSFIESMKDCATFLKNLCTSLIKTSAIIVADTATRTISKFFNLIVKGIKALWSIANITKEYYRLLKDNNLSVNEKFRLMKSISVKFIKVIIDIVDIVIDIIINLVLKTVDLSKWFMPIINVLLTFVMSIISFIVSMIIDSKDELKVNANNRNNYIKNCIY